MLKKFIPVFDLKIGKKEKKYANLCLKNSWLGQGLFVKKFEQKICKTTDTKYGVATTSGTTALHLACATIVLKKGDHVLVSSSTNMASVFAIIYCGAKPIPVDVNIENWQLKISDLKKKITKKTKAIMVVHLFGQAADMDPILDFAKEFNLMIIEDCAEALGVRYKGESVGSIGDIGTFSFYANKTITTGEGGMIITNSKKLYKKAKELKNLGYGKKNKFQHDYIGFNYRMPNISASIGLGQLENINRVFKQKQRIYNRYKINLINTPGIDLPKIEKWTSKYVMWAFNICVNSNFPLNRDQLQKKLLKYRIETRNAFVPANKQKTLIQKFDSYGKIKCPNADYIMRHGLYLPSGITITNKEIDYICDIIKKN